MFDNLISSISDYVTSGDEYDYEFLRNSILSSDDEQSKLLSLFITYLLDESIINDSTNRMRFRQIRDLINSCLLQQSIM